MAISTPKGGSLTKVGRPAPRWRRDLRRAKALATPTGNGEISFLCIQLEPTSSQGHEYQLSIDGYRWQGCWVMLDMQIDQPMQTLQSWSSPTPQAMAAGPRTLMISLQNLTAPGQKFTFELRGAWDVEQETAMGRITVKRQKPAEEKPEQKEWIPWE